MTANQIAYWNLQETNRANRVREATNWFGATETQRHNVATENLGSATLRETSRHNVASEGLTNRSILATIRGQDVAATTARRGQDLVYDSTTRGQTLSYNAAIRGQDITRETAYDKMLTQYRLGKYQTDVKSKTDQLGQIRQQESAYAKMATDLTIAANKDSVSLTKLIFGGLF